MATVQTVELGFRQGRTVVFEVGIVSCLHSSLNLGLVMHNVFNNVFDNLAKNRHNCAFPFLD